MKSFQARERSFDFHFRQKISTKRKNHSFWEPLDREESLKTGRKKIQVFSIEHLNSEQVTFLILEKGNTIERRRASKRWKKPLYVSFYQW